MADQGKRHLGWGTAVFVSFLITWAIVILFGVAPSQYVVRVNATYARIPDSMETRFIRDMVSQNYYAVVGVWLLIGAYQIQKIARRNLRVILFTILFLLPCIAFALVPEVLHGFINAYVSGRPPEQRPSTLYTLDEWLYTGYWVMAMGFFMLLTPGWIFGLKKLEDRLEGRQADRTSAFGRPVVAST